MSESILEIACITFFAVYTAAFVVCGHVASRCKRRFTKCWGEEFTPCEQTILKLPSEWLQASIRLTWLGKYLVSGSVLSSLAVLVLAVNDGSEHIASIAVLSMLGIAMTCVEAFFRCEGRAAAYRGAFLLADPVCTRFENRYSGGGDVAGFDRGRDFEELLSARDRGERVLAAFYGAGGGEACVAGHAGGDEACRSGRRDAQSPTPGASERGKS